MKKVEIHVEGMDCGEEVGAVRQALLGMPGLLEVEFDLVGQRLIAAIDERLTSADALRDAVGRSGLRAAAPDADHAPEESGRRMRTLATFLSGAAVASGFAVHAATAGFAAALAGDDGTGTPWLARVLYAAAVVAGAWFVAPKAWRALLRLRPDMNLLMAIAVLGAIVIGEWFEAATVAFLFATSLALEAWSIGRARRAITALMSQAPEQARVLHGDGAEQLVPVRDVAIASRVLVKPGERIPLDGRVVAGSTSVNQAAITGEAQPVPKQPGSEVFAGTVNNEGAIEVATTAAAGDTVLARVVRLVRQAQARRSAAEQWVDRFARVYTPLVVLLAAAMAVVPPLLGGSWERWFYEGLVLLVIACPCALVISTPVSIVAALAAAARNGVLVKGGAFLEIPARLQAIAFDKTGTLTEGVMAVGAVVPLSGHDEREVLEIAASIERRSEHPIARAIVAHAEARGSRSPAVTDYRAIPGRGAEAALAGRPVWIGSHRFLEERGEETPELHQRIEELAREGSTVVIVGEQGHVCGVVAVTDRVRRDARRVLDDLRAQGVERVVVLTGDNRPTAESVGRAVAADEVHSELLPEGKVAVVEELMRRHGTVAMVGDGVNDAPALAISSLGIAMGAAGSAVALETADVALMQDDLSRLPWLVAKSHRTRRVIRQNIFASLAVKLVFVVLALAGHASLWSAIAADMGMSLLVIANALRLLDSRTTAGSVGR